MIVPLAHDQWQALRATLRAEVSGPALGRELRLTPNRRTKDGTFLDELVAAGLLTVVGKPEPGESKEPVQFRTRYALTEKGRAAAEYGEYDRPFTPAETAPVGAAAEMLKARAARPWASGGSSPAGHEDSPAPPKRDRRRR